MPNRKDIFDEPLSIKPDLNADHTSLSSSPSPGIPTPTLTGGMQIPFSSIDGSYIYWDVQYNSTVTTNSSGAPASVISAAFGGNNSLSNNLTLTNPTKNPIGGSLNQLYYQTSSFCIPTDVTVEAINFTAILTSTAASNLTLTGTCFPFVILATGTTTYNTINTYTLKSETQTLANTPFVEAVTYNNGFCVMGERQNIGVELSAKTNVMIICGIIQTDRIGTTQSISNLAFTGSILFT